MPRGLDHIVHAVRDLDAAGEFYARAGFTVGARNKHPWGTHNRIVQLNDFYIELLTLAEPDKIVPHGARTFSFGAFNRDYLASREGLSMLLLKSTDAVADNASFAAADIGATDVFDFARDGVKPDGSVVKLAFSLAFTKDVGSPNACFGICQHHYPMNFWNPAFQTHANGARRVGGAVMTADPPSAHAEFLAAAMAADRLPTSAGGVAVRGPQGDVEIVTAAVFAGRYGAAPQGRGAGAGFAGLRLIVDDVDAALALFLANGLPARRLGNAAVIPAQTGFGATLIFETAGEG